MAFVMKDPVNAMTKAEPVDGKNTFTIPVTDVDGNTVYINFDVTVSAKNPADRAERTRKPKAKAETEAVEID